MVQPEEQKGGRGIDLAEIDQLVLYEFAADIGTVVRDHLMNGGEVKLRSPTGNKIRYLAVENGNVILN